MRTLFEVIVEPLSHPPALAPLDSEESTADTAAALKQARASLDRGEGIPHENILMEF